MNRRFFKQIPINDSDLASQQRYPPCILWFTGLSAAGKTTIANLVEKKLRAFGKQTYLLDGDNIRLGLNRDLGFSVADRAENIRRVAEVAKLMVDAGMIVQASFISPFRAGRKLARELVAKDEFIEIFVDTPLDIAEKRDPKGLYKRARMGEITDFTGVNSSYEPPDCPEIHIDTTLFSPEVACELILKHLQQNGYLDQSIPQCQQKTILDQSSDDNRCDIIKH